MRKLYVWRDGHFVDVTGERLEAKKKGLEGPNVIDDTMPNTWHPANGKHYNSKSAFRAVTKAHNCVEVGNDNIPPPAHELDHEERKRDIGKVYADLKVAGGRINHA